MSIALCDHPDIERILARLHEMGYAISPASLRLDDLTEPIVRVLRESGERTITIAPETGSDRLRRVINKTVTNDEILDRAELIFASGIENLKLYYMIGLPTETDDDLVAIRDLTLQMRDRMMKHARPRGQVGRIVGSVNPLIPKPGTAYQWLPMEDPATIDRKIKRLRSLMAGIDNVYFNIKSERHSYYQALLSLGDRRVAPAIEAAERNGQNWRAAVAEAGVDADFYIFRDRSRDADAAVGHHRRRHEGVVLPVASSTRACAKNGRCRRSARRRTRGCCRSFNEAGSIDGPFNSRSRRAPRIPETPRESARAACSAPSTSTIGRSSAKLRRSPLTLY